MKRRMKKSGVAGASAKVGAKGMTGDLLFEIGCEEIPAGMIFKATEELKAILAKHLVGADLVDEPTVQEAIETFGAPRRLVAIVRNVRIKQPDATREITGPPKGIAFDSFGKPTRAASSACFSSSGWRKA
ncbi:MAG: glycine--tRNA ligase subunit beta [Acidobacteriia bacterium]|nr:glycine--tRNA ligase subunit beta [Terriglobia bacterium]